VRPGPDGVAKLRDRIAFCKAEGLERAVLNVPRRGGNSPRTWDRALVDRGRPSLYGRCVGSSAIPGVWVFDVTIVDLEKWLDGFAPTEAAEEKL